jgi:adenylate kinase
MPEKVRQRLTEYSTKTALLTGYYDARGAVRRVDGMGSVDEVEQRIVNALETLPRP